MPDVYSYASADEPFDNTLLYDSLESWAAIKINDKTVIKDTADKEAWLAHWAECKECTNVAEVKYNLGVLESWVAIKVFKEANNNRTDKVTELAHRVESHEPTTISEIELYDLDASWHMFPHHQHFTTYCSISPWLILAADKGVFYVIETGDL